MKHILVGNLNPGSCWNEGILKGITSYSGCPFTVVALTNVVCATAVAAGEWTNYPMNFSDSTFAALSQSDLTRYLFLSKLTRLIKNHCRLESMEILKKKFRDCQTYLLQQIAKERTKDPNASIQDVSRLKF
jgi:hypothetical protein